MKRTILFLLLLTSLTAFAHEDTYKAVEKSNVHIMVQVGYESSLELRIVESYAEIINDFIKEIDSTEKVFIHFSEDYCFFNENSFFVAYGEFKQFVPSGFPWGYKYDMKFINTQEGIGIIISAKYFKLKTLLQLLEFGLQNKNYLKNSKEKIFKEKKYESETARVIDSIMQNKLSDLTNEYLSRKVILNNTPKVLTDKNIQLFLHNDSIYFVDTNDSEILRLSTINSISYEPQTDCLFLFNTNSSFYFINRNLSSNQKQYDLPFSFGCLEAIWIEKAGEKYKLEKDRWFRVVVGDNPKIEDWVYFDEKNGITKEK